MAYIITSRGAFGKTYYTGSVVLGDRFSLNANKVVEFPDIGDAKDALAEMKPTLNKQIFERAVIETV